MEEMKERLLMIEEHVQVVKEENVEKAAKIKSLVGEVESLQGKIR